MYNFKHWRQVGKITEEDVRNLREELHVGDYVWDKSEKAEEYSDGRIRIRTKFKKVKVLAKFPNLVVVSGKGPKVHTMLYKEILMYDLEREKKTNERSMG